MKNVPVKIYNVSNNPFPKYAKEGDAGMDICANRSGEVYPGETKMIPTGIHVAIPLGYEIQVRPRSGLSAKTKMRIANSPGTIDAGFRGEICVIMENIGIEPWKYNVGDRIAQIVLQEVPVIEWDVVASLEDLGDSVRGVNGFGSTGVN